MHVILRTVSGIRVTKKGPVSILNKIKKDKGDT